MIESLSLSLLLNLALGVPSTDFIDHFFQRVDRCHQAFTFHVFLYILQLLVSFLTQKHYQHLSHSFLVGLISLGSNASLNVLGLRDMEGTDWSLRRCFKDNFFLLTFFLPLQAFYILDYFFQAIPHLHHLFAKLQLFLLRVTVPQAQHLIRGQPIWSCWFCNVRRCIAWGKSLDWS